jgi:hypothetical protein
MGGTPMPHFIRKPQRPLAVRLAGDHRLLIALVFEAGFVIEFDLIDLAHERAIVVRGVQSVIFILMGGFGDEFSVACHGTRFPGSGKRCVGQCIDRCGDW